jgi:hypothetical protein
MSTRIKPIKEGFNTEQVEPLLKIMHLRSGSREDDLYFA